MASASDFAKYRLLMWKNLRLLCRNRKSLLTTILVPFFSLGLLVLLRSITSHTRQERFNKSYPTLGLDVKPDSYDFPVEQFVYTPKSYKPQMDSVQRKLQFTSPSIGFDTQQEAMDYIASQNGTSLAGIVFDLNNETNILKITLRFYPITDWLTESLWDINRIGIRNPEQNDGGMPPGYYRKGFIRVQNALYEAHTNDAYKVSISLERMPTQEFVQDDFHQTLLLLAPLLFFFAFFNTFVSNVKCIVQEKESALKEMMLIMGLPNYIDWLGWFSKFMLENLPITILMVVVLKLPLYSTVACLHLTDGFLFWLLMLCFITSMTSFSLMVSTIFKSSNRASTWMTVIMFGVMLPFISAANVRDVGWLNNCLTLLFCGSSFGMAVKMTAVLEDMGVGLQWKYLFYSVGGNSIAVGWLMISMLLASAVYMWLALYFEQVIPGQFGVPRKWYFPLETLLRKYSAYSELNGDNSMGSEAFLQSNRCMEQPPSDVVPGMTIRNLSKVFDNHFVAVKGLSMNIYPNEITILLGENGAGKSTTMSMLTGVIPPSSGSASIYNLDISKDMKRIREMIGLCPQQNVLFSKLTVEEHLLFFGMLKGLSQEEATKDALKLMNRMDLKRKADTWSEKLSGGMKRKLNLGISLCGGTKAVFLDEPTSGVDPASRREIWNVLQEEKKQRMILLSTHFMDEADVLGDRVAILHHGELKCSGSAFFLKTLFESSYKLNCALHEGATIEPVTDMIRKFVPEAKLRDVHGIEYAFDLSPKYLSSFGELFKALESTDSPLGVESYGIELPSLEDVFFKIQMDNDQPDSVGYTRVNVDEDRWALLTGPALMFSQLKSVFWKKFYFHLRNPFTFIFYFLLPTLMLAYLMYSQWTAKNMKGHDGLHLNLNQYGGNVVTLIEAEEKANQKYVDNYMELATSGRTEMVSNLNERIYGMTALEYYDFKNTAIMGAYFKADKSIVAFFNNEPYHSAPIALTNVYNAIIKSENPDHPRLEFVNNPIPEKLSETVQKIINMAGFLALGSLMTVALSYWSGFFGLLYVDERQSGMMHLQFTSGFHPCVYWSMNFFWDLLLHGLCMTLVVIFAVASGMPALQGSHERFYLVLYLFGFSALPFVYWRALRYKKPWDLSGNIALIGFLSLAGYGIYLAAVTAGYINKEKSEMVFMLLPFFNLIDALVKHSLASVGMGVPEDLHRNYMMFIGTGLFWLLIIIICDMKGFSWLSSLRIKREIEPQQTGQTDSDVLEERQLVDAMGPQEIAAEVLVAKHLRKCYGKLCAVEDATFVLKRGECLGLLGKNGAGKTTTFKMLTGEEQITEGDAWLKGFSIRSDLMKTYKHFGYCPQTDALLHSLTGVELMKIICMIRGVSAGDVTAVSMALAMELGFDKHMRKKVSAMSGGNKRKLNTALALIGEPEVIYMDEPTTGMDPSAKRRVWNVVKSRRQNGDSLVLTSHSMEECEALCTRLVILMNGRMEAIASSYRLKQKYSKTGHLVIQLERKQKAGKRENQQQLQQGGVESNLTELKEVLRSKLNGWIVKEEYEGKLQCEFSAEEKLSKLFGLMESLKEEYHIESYAVSNQSALVTIFLDCVAQEEGQGSSSRD